MNLLRKNLIWLVVALLIFLGLLQLFGPRYIKYLDRTSHTLNGLDYTKSPSISPDYSPSSSNHPANSATIKPVSDFAGPVVYYANNKFSPEKILLKQDGSGFGCLLRIVNQSQANLIIRLGPYELSVKDNYGSKYEPVLPGKFLIIDPRFGMKTEEYLNLEHPEEKFRIDLDKSCIPE